MRLDHLLSKEEEVRVGIYCLVKYDFFKIILVEDYPKGKSETLSRSRGSRSQINVKSKKIFPVAIRLGETPVLIPNTKVKT